MFDKLSPISVTVFTDAKALAAKSGTLPVTTVHVLLALALRPESQGGRLLGRLGLSPAVIQSRLALSSTDNREEAGLMLGPSIRRLLERAEHEAATLHSPSISTGHLVLAMAYEPDSPAGRLLTEEGVEIATLRQSVANQAPE
jgi:ATP-dependent Clp protease ATP-binding subunit ClpA